MSDGKAKHTEELTDLKKVQAAHETLAQAVARTQKEVEKQRLDEGKAKIKNETQTAANEIGRRHSEDEIGPVQAAMAVPVARGRMADQQVIARKHPVGPVEPGLTGR